MRSPSFISGSVNEGGGSTGKQGGPQRTDQLLGGNSKSPFLRLTWLSKRKQNAHSVSSKTEARGGGLVVGWQRSAGQALTSGLLIWSGAGWRGVSSAVLGTSSHSLPSSNDSSSKWRPSCSCKPNNNADNVNPGSRG